ncbi:type VI secretion protein IcmF [Siccirubricoccus deserti]|uniref:Type VI secretion system membrane subunit TssM n=1 Tax=Siccirubricoccus deserti TaxID=2013562 RepID=A0A9X0QU59_9PROT|nr:type VI secretion system membrane subunit TssM [Siccirubricoccus deserti]MBC4013744.1 type VI secretion system membrane subunit TssM [Siccirubricoccus deserti]GGC29150.1 type VI secretion protein IcmF [Siccirubricoccus deserti]
MRAIKSFLRSPWVRTFIGAVMVCVLVWMFGDLVAIGEIRPLGAEWARAVAIAVIMVAWLVSNLVRMLRQQRKDKQLVEAVAAPPTQGELDAAASADEVALLATRLKEAQQALKKSGMAGRFGTALYQQPWYMFIGPPGSGKTTALVNSGLNFPLADKGAVAGVGGTRNCDWWFTDQAVLIDTAGRYTTQDSQAAVDSASWLGFLGLLKKHRPRQPINGVLLAISLSDLSAMKESEQAEHARTIRNRLRELHEQLGVRMPVYVMFTKADLIAGFIEFYDSLGKEEREQVWGMTFPLDDGKDPGAAAVTRFGTEYDALLQRLTDRMLERVHQEPDIQRRALIYGFPQQMASLRETAQDFLTAIFQPSRLETPALLRGVYFSSGTQNGMPMDRLLGAMASNFGLQRQAVTAFSGQGRSYFLTRLMKEVVFLESGLVGLDPRLEKRNRWIWGGAYAAAALLLVAMTGAWFNSWLGNRDMIAAAQLGVNNYEAQLAILRQNPAPATELPPVLPALATLRGLPGGYEQREAGAPLGLTFGLWQGSRLGSGAQSGYRHGLNMLLLPRLLARVETQLRNNIGNADYLYNALKVYLILGRRGPLDAALVTDWIAADVDQALAEDEPARAAVLAHVTALLEEPVAEVPLDGLLIEQVRSVLRQVPLAQRSYQRILTSQPVRRLREWRIGDAAGPAANRVFVLRSGRPLSTGIPGIYTYNGYRTVFLPVLPEILQDVAEATWVLGSGDEISVTDLRRISQLRRDVQALYFEDYIRRWDAVLADVQMRPFQTMSDGLDVLNTLSGPVSPFRNLLKAIAAETHLVRAEEGAGPGGAAGRAARNLQATTRLEVLYGLSYRQRQAAEALRAAFVTEDTRTPDPAIRVDEHFKRLRDFVGTTEQPGELEQVVAKLLQLYQGFSQAAAGGGAGLLSAAAGGGGGAAAGGSLPSQLQTLARTLPAPIDNMVAATARSSASVTASGARAQIAENWRSNIAPFCATALNNRYPFSSGSPIDVPIDDFTRLLGPGGMVDSFFTQNLRPFVDTVSRPWRWQSVDNAQLGFSADSLVQFQRAADIRDGLFAGGPAMVVRFELLPVSLDPAIAQVSLDMDGQQLSYAHGPQQPVRMQWPGPGGRNQVRLTMTPTAGAPTIVERTGPWALYRLLDTARVASDGQPDRFTVTFNAGGRSAVFRLTASSVMNPFTMTAMRQFRCPAGL